MIIDQLPAIQLPVQGTDEIAIERGQLTYKGQIKDLPTALRARNLVTVPAASTATFQLPGLTEDHVVANWGMFSDIDLTTPIPENAPNCDIEITTATDSWTLKVENFTSTFYIRPTFVKG